LFFYKVKWQTREKTLLEKSVAEYEPSLPGDEIIGALPQDNEMIRDRIGDILRDIRQAPQHTPEDFADGILPKTAGYAFLGSAETATALFLVRKNPFLSPGNGVLAAAKKGVVQEAEDPLLRFVFRTDLLLLDGMCYFFGDVAAKDLDLPSRAQALCMRRIDRLKELDLLSDPDTFIMVAMSPKQTRKFVNFDSEVLEHIAALGITARQDFCAAYDIPLDADGKLETADPEAAAAVVDLLCARTCLDVLGRVSLATAIRIKE
jgi:hypothetical protein